MTAVAITIALTNADWTGFGVGSITLTGISTLTQKQKEMIVDKITEKILNLNTMDFY